MTGENTPVEDVTATAPVAVVTGASSGIGRAGAEELARRGWAVALVGRDAGRLSSAVDRVRTVARAPIAAYRCDFTELDQVRALAAELTTAYPRIDLLANNAGGIFAARRVTVDGFETTIQVNHLAHFLLSHELRAALRGGRIVNTSSAAHARGMLEPDDLAATRRRYLPLRVYGTSKQANVLFAAEAARRWPEIVSTSYHPGVVRSRFGNESAVISFFYRIAPFLRSPAKGAETLVWLATAEASALRSGGYYLDQRERRPAAHASDPELAARLWEVSHAAVYPGSGTAG